MSRSTLINQSNVAVLCTTDDPIDSLEYHKLIAEKGHIKAKVLPAFRPDRLTILKRPILRIISKHLETYAV